MKYSQSLAQHGSICNTSQQQKEQEQLLTRTTFKLIDHDARGEKQAPSEC